MKLRIIYTFLLFLFGSFLLLSHSAGRASVFNEGNTGAPNDNSNNGRTCQTCHNSGPFQVTPTLTITDSGGNEVTGNYFPGTTYNVKLTIDAAGGTPSGYGFQMVALNAATNSDGAPINTWVVPMGVDNVKVATPANGRQYAEQDGTSASNEFMMEWTAPANGDVTFYYGANAVDANGENNGDVAAMSSLELTIDPTSTNELEKAFSLEIFPNPVSEVLNLKSSAVVSDTYDLFLYDQTGRQILIQQINIPSGKNISPIDVNDLSTGVYNLIISDGKNQIAKKMLKL